MSGWIKLHRCITEHWLYTEKRTFSKFEAWNDILLTVNFSDAQVMIKGKLYLVKRGQSILSLESWGKRWGWDKGRVRRFLSLLQNENMIELISDNITTQLTVCKYETYQGERNADETHMKRKRNANELQTTPIKEEEEYKEEKEEKERVLPAHAAHINFKKQSEMDFINEMRNFEQLYSRDMLNTFYQYWSERDAKGMMRFQREKTWELDKRLMRWKSKQKEYGKAGAKSSVNDFIEKIETIKTNL